MKKTILITLMFTVFSALSAAQSQNDTIMQLQHRIENLEKLNSDLNKKVGAASANIRRLEAKVSAAADSLGAMRQELARTNSSIQAVSDKLEQQIGQLSSRTDSGFSGLDTRIKHNSLFFLVTAVIMIILIPAILIIWFMRRLASLKEGLANQLKSNSLEIQDEIKKIDNQVFWSLDMLKGQASEARDETVKTDHSLALKVADEIIRIQKNINKMDPDTKGIKQMEFALERIRDNFREYGYEIVDMLNKPYVDGMLVTAKFVQDDNLKPGEKIITRIIKPQVKYNDTIIQDAEVEVSTG